MKKQFSVLALCVLMGSSVFFNGCADKCKTTVTFMEYKPVYMEESAFRSAVKVEGAKTLEKPGKIWTNGNYLYINEVGKGIHIVDNSNPSNPVKISFISIPGNYDLAVQDNKLFTDSSVDLLVFDVSNPASPVLQSRQMNAFPHMITYKGYEADPSQGIVVDWKHEVRTETFSECNASMPILWQMNQVDPNVLQENSTDNANRGISSAPTGSNKGGSMARFGIKGDNLYIVTTEEIRTYQISGYNTSLLSETSINAGWNTEAETVFPYENMLFVGKTNGVDIYSIENPASPAFISSYDHASGCDPVVVFEDNAYITLNNDNDNPCNGWTNQLELVDVSNPANPMQSRTWQMTQPKGLGIDKGLLFIADGEAGLQVFDASNPQNVGDNKVAEFSDIKGYDVIANKGTLIVTGSQGITQYDYQDAKNIKLLSKLSVGQ